MSNCFSSEKADCVITIMHLLEIMAIMGIPIHIITDDDPTDNASNKMKQFFTYYNIKHVTGIPHNLTGQAVVESQSNLKRDAY